MKTFLHCWLREESRADAAVFLLDPRPAAQAPRRAATTRAMFSSDFFPLLPQVLLLRCAHGGCSDGYVFAMLLVVVEVEVGGGGGGGGGGGD